MTPKKFKQFKDGIFKHMQNMKIEREGTHSFEVDLSDAVGQVEFSVAIREYEHGDGFNECRVVDTELTLVWVDVKIINNDGEEYMPDQMLAELESEVKTNMPW